MEEIVEELQKTDEEITKLQRCDMLDSVDKDLSNAHFEFRLHDALPSALKNVEIVMQHAFLAGGQVRMNMIYSDKCFHVVLREGEGEHNLDDVTFPQLEKHGDGYALRVYDDENDGDHIYFQTLKVFGDFDVKKESSKMADVDDAPEASEAHDVGRHLKGYNQTYVLYKQAPHSGPSPFRSVFFRCGNFCYTGHLDTGTTSPSLASLPSIVPTLQTQQTKLAYVGVIDDLLRFGRWSML